MNKVNKIKLTKVAIGLLNNKSYTQAMIDAGYDEETAKRGRANRVIDEAINQNISVMEKQGMSKERCVEELMWGIEESKGLKIPKERLQLHSTYMSIIARHYLPEKSEIDTTLKVEEQRNLLQRFTIQ